MTHREPEEIYPPRGYVLISANRPDSLAHHAIFETLDSAREAARIIQRNTGADINVAVIGARQRTTWEDDQFTNAPEPTISVRALVPDAWVEYMRDNDPPTVI